MGFRMLLDAIALVLMVVAIFAFFFGFMVVISPFIMFNLGVALYIIPRILAGWFGGYNHNDDC